jgi:peptidoglycan-associated lipoprotein
MNMKKISINQTFKVENIYYDLNKWAIRPEAGKELDKLVVILKDNPDIIVELGSHTDCRASDDYNLNLSQKRAESAVAYIISKGIGKDRITAKGSLYRNRTPDQSPHRSKDYGLSRKRTTC